MLKILQARLQQYMNHELPDVQAGFRKGRGTRDQNANIRWIIEKARESQKNICFCFIDYAKTFDCVDHNKLWKVLQEMGIPDHLTCLLRNLYAGQKATVRTGHGRTDRFQTGKNNSPEPRTQKIFWFFYGPSRFFKYLCKCNPLRILAVGMFSFSSSCFLLRPRAVASVLVLKLSP